MTKFIVCVTFVTIILGYLSFKLLELIYWKQEHSYIDEIFHVDQAQRYCNNNWFEWDPKITTFPGLYVTSLIFLKPLHIVGYQDFCTLFMLRLTNLLATILNFILSLQIIICLDKKYMLKTNKLITLVSALNISLFPPLYFFTFLYYTDVWSTTFVLLMYKLHLTQNLSKLVVALSCLLAVLMRQTNIVWVGFLIIDKAWEILSRNFKTAKIQNYEHSKKIVQQTIYTFLKSQKKPCKGLSNLMVSVFFETYHLIFICTLFLVFVIYNGSIVLGDKTAHTVVLHPMQNLYFLNFAGFFGLPFTIIEVSTIWKKPPKLLVLMLSTVVCTIVSELNKMEHPYLLADNRHIAFYIWKRIFGHYMIRRLLIPTYVFSGILFYRNLQGRCHFMLRVGLTFCIFCILTPQHLFELRYFIIPFIMWRLHIKQHPIVLLEFIFFTIINIWMVYLFLNKPLEWPNEPGVKQRFIWMG